MKKFGHCTLCDEQIFEIAMTYREGSLAGHPRELGKPLPSARQVTLVLIDGSSTDLSFCSDCEITPQNLPKIHHRMRERWAFDSTNKTRTQIKPGNNQKSPDPLTTKQEWIHGAWNLGQVDNVPIGVLHERLWQDVIEEEARR